MSKPKAPKAPDYQAAAVAQGEANLNSALATNATSRYNQVGPNGSLTYNNTGSYTLPDGKVIPTQTATTTLSPQQQALYDQTNQISQALNNSAIKGIGYVDATANKPFDTSILGDRVNSIAGSGDFAAQRDMVTNGLLSRINPQIQQQDDQLRTTLANQGLQPGSEAYNRSYQQFGQRSNDAIVQAMLAGGQEQTRMAQLDQAAGNFQNTSRQQGVQEQAFFRDTPLNTLNALRTGNQTNMPQFQQSSGANIAAAPLYAATNDLFNAQNQQYQAANTAYSGLMQGLGSLGSSAITAGLG